MKNLLGYILLLVIGLFAMSFLVGVVMDVLAITVFQFTGWDLSVSFVENTLSSWPGGEVIAALVFQHPVASGAVVSSVLQLMVAVSVRCLVPPLFAGTVRGLQPFRMLLVGFADMVISCLIAIGVGWLFQLGINEIFEGFLGTAAQWVFGLSSLMLIGLAAAIALGLLKRGRVLFSFTLVTAVGRYALATLALITWSMHATAGSFMIVGCILACGILHVVDGRVSGLW